jgi:SP family general alpha glucoside:H+ symporter-like MFS transporter
MGSPESVTEIRSKAAMAGKGDIKMDSSSVAHETVDLKKGNLLEIDATKDITTAEHELGFWEAVKQYPYAVFWALFFCIAVIMAGFDAQIITSFYALPSFQSHYGTLYDGEYIITAPWQTGTFMS